jgi:hypothetical protein
MQGRRKSEAALALQVAVWTVVSIRALLGVIGCPPPEMSDDEARCGGSELTARP